MAWRLLMDGRVPFSPKLIMPVAVLYAFFPIDLVPDVFLAAGQIDDFVILIFATLLFVRICPKELVREHLDAMAGRRRPRDDARTDPKKVIDGDYEVLD